jgi:hypothetical protein
VRLREFRASGIEAFRRLLENWRENSANSTPDGLLEEETATELVRPSIEVERRDFATKAQAAAYLSEILAPLPDREVATNAGLWTWLACFWFDTICPIREGRRRVKNDAYYVYEPNNPRRFYYHLLYLPWHIVHVAPTYNRLLLCGSLATMDEIAAEVMKRLYLLRIPCIFEVLDRLYWDEERRCPRRGIIPRHEARPGDLRHRLPLRVRQLEMTYDLQSLNADQLIELLGEEFQVRAAPKSRARTAPQPHIGA